jgi:uncharacterized small protein (DUF1192 family)
MSMFDEEAPRKKRVHEMGQDLSLLSIDELTERIGQLKEEIRRLEAERTAKGATRNAADALFRKG